MKLGDLGFGQYVDKGKYDTAVAEKENLAGQIKTLNTTIGDLVASYWADHILDLTGGKTDATKLISASA